MKDYENCGVKIIGNSSANLKGTKISGFDVGVHIEDHSEADLEGSQIISIEALKLIDHTKSLISVMGDADLKTKDELIELLEKLKSQDKPSAMQSFERISALLSDLVSISPTLAMHLATIKGMLGFG